MLKIRKNIVLTSLAAVLCMLPAGAQWFPAMLPSSPTLPEADSNKLSVAVDMTGFFKNNEYFSPVADGQTLPGTILLPALGYQVSGKFRAEAGAWAVKYSGHNPMTRVQAFIRLQYAITPAFNMVMGNIYGGADHRLIEPLYRWERHYTENPESGLQFVLHSERWFTDVWVDWQHFIRRDDPEQETLTFGTSASYVLTGPGSRYGLTIPAQLLIHHRGGQIDTSDDPMIVLGNIATGLCWQWNADMRWLRSVGLDVYVAGYYDRYPNDELRPCRSGLGVYPVLHVAAMPLEFMAGYWQSSKWYAFEGEPLFGSFNPYRPGEQLGKRKLLTLKLAYDKEVVKGVSVGAHVETYSDLARNETDYSFGVILRFNKRFLIRKL